MKTISLAGVASYLPERVVGNDFFQANEVEDQVPLMFRGVRFRHHVGEDDTAVAMIGKAAGRLAERLNINLARDVDLLLTNVTCPDMPFTGCGAAVSHQLGMRPAWVLDLHNGGCVSFVLMMAYAQSLMHTHGLRSALLCNVQNAGGRIFSSPENRARKQARIPGDGCGVGYLVANDECPVRSIVVRTYGESADDMRIVRDDGTRWWEPGPCGAYVDFNETNIAEISSRSNRIVPEVVREACQRADLRTQDIGTLITNQPNRIFMRNWREALQVSPERHVQTFERHGNLFGAALPICFEEALALGQVRPDSHVVFGGFSHAGDFAGAAVVHWQPGTSSSETFHSY